jgi:hypothetical protein
MQTFREHNQHRRQAQAEVNLTAYAKRNKIKKPVTTVRAAVKRVSPAHAFHPHPGNVIWKMAGWLRVSHT